MKVAIVHYWLVGMRGGEKVVEAICDIFPDADIFTHVYDPARISETIRRHRVSTTFINRLPFARRLYQKYLPLMPLALEQLDLRDYDLVISSESGPAKGVITRPDAIHVCYCHTPMRYVWNMYHDYLRSANPLLRPLQRWLIHSMRMWDLQSASLVDAFIANSHNIARQIRKYYGRDALVVYPPVDVDSFAPSPEHDSYYLYVGQLTAYKRVDLAIQACNRLKRPLVVIGDGEEFKHLSRLAGPMTTLMGRQGDDVLRRHYARCRALLFPGEEDFGIVPVEAMASGRPVIAFHRGGATETVREGLTGTFFEAQTVDAVVAAIEKLEAAEPAMKADAMVEQARHFSNATFRRAFLEALSYIASHHNDPIDGLDAIRWAQLAALSTSPPARARTASAA